MQKLAAAALVCLSALPASTRQLTPAWVEVGENGARVARVVVTTPAECPRIVVEGESQPMNARLPVPQGFMPACEAAIPKTAKSASVEGRTLALPKPNPSKIAVFGDTGCRVKGEEIQDCNDPAKWPLPKVAARAAAAKPGLMIHVGDYLYREDMCPPEKQSFCGGNPSGDNWETWNADFFAPAAKLLSSVPWVFARGNHENCERAWRGWFYYLDPHPWRGDQCEAYPAPYSVRLGAFELEVFDSSAVAPKMTRDQIERYARELRSIRASHAWLVAHHPFWGFYADGPTLAPASVGLQQAWQKADPLGIDLVISGHVHLFELLSFDHGLPPALVTGHGGTDLSNPIETPLAGVPIGYARVVAGASEREFGYTLLTRAANGWRLTLRNVDGRLLVACSIHGSETFCNATER